MRPFCCVINNLEDGGCCYLYGHPVYSIKDGPDDFEWDDAKATKNLRDHGVTFEYSTAVFLDPNALRVDTTRKEDFEAREKMIGQIDEKLFTVVFTLRGNVVRVISARRSNRKEETAYGKSII